MFKPVIGNHIAMYPAGEKMSLFNKSTGKTYVIGINEARTISLFDGTRTIDEISRDSGIFPLKRSKNLSKHLRKLVYLNQKKGNSIGLRSSFRFLIPTASLKKTVILREFYSH